MKNVGRVSAGAQCRESSSRKLRDAGRRAVLAYLVSALGVLWGSALVLTLRGEEINTAAYAMVSFWTAIVGWIFARSLIAVLTLGCIKLQRDVTLSYLVFIGIVMTVVALAFLAAVVISAANLPVDWSALTEAAFYVPLFALPTIIAVVMFGRSAYR